MLLEVHERIALLSIWPKEGTYAGLKTLRRAKEAVSFNPEEVKLYEFKNSVVNGVTQTQWSNVQAAKNVKDVPLDEFTVHTLRNILAAKNADGKLTEEFISVYEKLVIDYQ